MLIADKWQNCRGRGAGESPHWSENESCCVLFRRVCGFGAGRYLTKPLYNAEWLQEQPASRQTGEKLKPSQERLEKVRLECLCRKK